MTDTAPDTTKSMNEDEGYRKELLARCELMGLSVHPNAKNDTIAAKIAAHLKADPVKPEGEAPKAEVTSVEVKTVVDDGVITEAKASDNDGRNPPALTKEQLPLTKSEKDVHPSKRLHRVIITCNDPQKADQSGDIISVSNGVVGNIRFYFHFNKPWHVPEIILDTLKESKLFLHASRKDGREIITREVPRYNIQVLPPLTEKERHRINDKQTAALASED